MAHQVIADAISGIHYTTGTPFIYTAVRNAFVRTDVKAPAKETQVKDPALISSAKWSPWGSGNKWPQEVLADLRYSSIAKRAFNIRAAAHVGSDILFYTEEVNEAGKIIKKPVINPELRRFMEVLRIRQQHKGLALDLETFAHGYIEVILTEDMRNVYSYKRLKTAMVRKEKINEKSGRVEHVYVSAKWPNPEEKYWVKVPVFDPHEPSKHKKFVIPVDYETIEDTLYYALPDWHGVRQNGWMAISKAAPALKEAVLTNMSIIRYHIKYPEDYWQKYYEDWDTKSPEEKKKLKDETFEAIEKMLLGADKAGKSFFSAKGISLDGKEMPGWEIETIDNKGLEGLMNADSKAANGEIAAAIGVNPSLFGILPGSTEAGSGSNMREAFRILQALATSDRDASLYPLYVLKWVLNWPAEWRIDYVDTDVSQTLDQNPTGKQKIA